MTAAQGPRSTAISTAPTACAVVPSGIGTLNIITRNEYAPPIATSGTYRLRTTFLTLRPAVNHAGTEAPYRVAQVAGLRYPSGMCILRPPFVTSCATFRRE